MGAASRPRSLIPPLTSVARLMPPDAPPHRPIRSYVLREGRLTAGQERAFAALWPRSAPFGVRYTGIPARPARALRQRPAGSGGDRLRQRRPLATLASATRTATTSASRSTAGVGHLLLRLEANALANVRLLRHDAVECCAAHCRPASHYGRLSVLPDPCTSAAITSDASSSRARRPASARHPP